MFINYCLNLSGKLRRYVPSELWIRLQPPAQGSRARIVVGRNEMVGKTQDIALSHSHSIYYIGVMCMLLQELPQSVVGRNKMVSKIVRYETTLFHIRILSLI